MVDNIRRINDRFAYVDRVGASDVYRKFKIQFDALFNSNEIAKNKEEFEKIYVHDYDFESKLEAFRTSVGASASFCVGYTGIGKTTTIRHCFDLGIKNVVTYIEERKELIFPAFYDGYNPERDYSDDLAKKISSVCTFIQRENPELNVFMRSNEGLQGFFRFIEDTKPEIVEVDPMEVQNMTEIEEIEHRLKYAYKYYKYSYYAERLKYLISMKYDKYERFIILLDDVESLPYDLQQNLIRSYLSFFECMQNTKFPRETEYNINLLISLRPHTFRIYNNNRNIEAYPVYGTPITKDQAVDLSELFEKRFRYYTEINPRVIGNKDTWQHCYDELENMNQMFGGQYKTMIINLCYMNIRQALSYYSKVFANRMWVQKNKALYAEFTVEGSDYTFNNITVLRALGCNENQVYFNDAGNIFPCLFVTSREKDSSIYSLLLLNMFYKKRIENEYYGVKAQTKKDVLEKLRAIFSKEDIDEFEDCLYYLFEKRIFRKSIKDKDDYKTMDRRESLKGDSRIYMSSKGTEMWDMFARDSVLLEMFREELYRDYARNEFKDLASQEAMGNQEDIFLDCLNYIEYLSYQEEDLVGRIETEKQKEKFMRMIDGSACRQLLTGVEKSLIYSGKSGIPDIAEKLNWLKSRV